MMNGDVPTYYVKCHCNVMFEKICEKKIVQYYTYYYNRISLIEKYFNNLFI